MVSHRGVLVVIEGINGAGKTTIVNELLHHFKQICIDAIFYKFPNRDGIYGSQIDLYLKGEQILSSKYDVLNMFAADRASVATKIKKNLDDGKIVICDRYIYSAIAYHIPLSVTNPQIINNYCKVIGHFDSKMPTPDIVYLIDGDHLLKRGTASEKFHYSGTNSRKMHNMIYKVISLCTKKFIILKNKEDRLDDLVQYILNDIFVRQ